MSILWLTGSIGNPQYDLRRVRICSTYNGRRTIMRKLLSALVLLTILPVSAIAGPKEDAFKVIEQFKMAFDSADVPGVVRLFAPDAVFLGTVSPKLATKTA